MVFGKCKNEKWKTEFKFLKISSMRSKALCLRLSEPIAWLAAYTTPYALRHQLSRQAFVKGNGKNTCVNEICKISEIYG